MTLHPFQVSAPNSRISFKVGDSENGRPWWYYLNIDDEPLYLVSNICDTCPLILGRYNNGNFILTPEELSQKLRNGLTAISPEIIALLSSILPSGDYYAGLIQVSPIIARPYTYADKKKKSNEESQYWWQNEPNFMLKAGCSLNELIEPLTLGTSLSLATINQFKERLSAGEAPTALALSVLDVRCLSGKALEVTLVHFLLDGHHKMKAAEELKMPLNILSLLWKNWPFTLPAFLEETLELRYGETSNK